MEPREQYQTWQHQILALNDQPAGDEYRAARAAAEIASEVEVSNLPSQAIAGLLFMCSSVLINAGCDQADADLLTSGKKVAESALARTTVDWPLHYQCRYNIANAVNAASEIGLPQSNGEWEAQLVDGRVKHSEQLRFARSEFFLIGRSDVADYHTRSAAYCNLANMLDYSGRWAEAYDFYLRALEIDASNGNAAGNLAQLLAGRVHSGIGQTGHIAAVYDKYVALAKELREGTLEYAAASVAERWEQLTLSDSEGHLAHGIDDLESDGAEYRLWIAERRLALSPAVEGLGTEDPRWDNANIQRLYGAIGEDANPPILAAMNVLKSDFLVSRRLAFEADVQISAGLHQAKDDSGYYLETLDHSLYGTQYSKLLLAQRSALDVLDKTAVVANEHFDVGDVPSQVYFRKFWSEQSGELRVVLVKARGRARPNLALAELADDMADDGMYSASQALRNAGTHRIVHAALLSPTGITKNSRSTISLKELVESTILALQVTRSAFLYLIDLVAMWNDPDDHPGHYIEIPNVAYILDFASNVGADPDRRDCPSDA